MPLSKPEQENHCGISVCAAAACFGIDICKSQRISGGFSGAVVFKVTDSQSRLFAIRLIPLEQSPSEQRLDLLFEMLCGLRQLGQTGIAIPLTPMRNFQWHSGPLRCEGRSSCVVGDFRVLAEPWIDGQAVNGVPNQEQLANAMTYLSSLHQRLQTAAGGLPKNEWFSVRRSVSPGLGRRIRIISELFHGGLDPLLSNCSIDRDPEFRKLAARTGEIARTWLPQLQRLTSRIESKSFFLQPILRDVWRPHVLFQNDHVSGIIDTIAAATDHPVLDYVRLFRSWFGADCESIEAAYRELAERCRMNFEERQLLQSIDACSSILSPITWLNRRIASPRDLPLDEDRRNRMDEVIRIAESFRILSLV